MPLIAGFGVLIHTKSRRTHFSIYPWLRPFTPGEAPSNEKWNGHYTHFLIHTPKSVRSSPPRITRNPQKSLPNPSQSNKNTYFCIYQDG